MNNLEISMCQFKKDFISQFITEIKENDIVRQDKLEDFELIYEKYIKINTEISDKNKNCIAITKKNKYCSRKKINGSKYCGIHKKKYDPDPNINLIKVIELKNGKNIPYTE